MVPAWTTAADRSALVTPARRPGSVRRTSHVDLLPHGPRMAEGFRLVGRARDLATDDAGLGRVLAEAAIDADIGPGHVATSLTTEPAIDGRALVGRPVTTGFRARLDEVVPDERDASTPLFLLLDELPIAAVISGYADLYAAPAEVGPAAASPEAAQARADICAGWAAEAHMMQTIRREGRLPVPHGPPAAETVGDAVGWHRLGDLPPGAMRRRRRLDVDRRDGQLVVDAMFRDTHVDRGGQESVLHEWWVDVVVDEATLVVVQARARPGPLPWGECPSAGGSAGRLVGERVVRLRSFVRTDLRGTSTCTHLNDLLRSLADVPAVAAGVASPAPPQPRGTP